MGWVAHALAGASLLLELGCTADPSGRAGGTDTTATTGPKADDPEATTTGAPSEIPLDGLCLGAPERLDWPGVPPRALVDVDGDGRADVLTTSYVGDRWAARVFLGHEEDGTGRWQTMVETVLDPGQGQLIDDVDGDGRSDIVIIGDVLTSQLGTEDGTFAPAARTFSVGPYVAFATADFDDDGLLDLLGATYQGRIQSLRGLGDGDFEFAAGLDVPIEQDAVQLFADEVDGTNVGLLTGVAAGCLGCQSSQFSLIRIETDGTMQSVAGIEWSAGWETIVPTIGELFGGGSPEIIVELGLDQRSIFTEQGGELVATGALTNGARAFGDLNGDDRPELVVHDEQRVRVFTDGGDALAETLSVPAASAPELWVADVDGDGLGDVVTFDPVGYDPGGSRPYIAVRRSGPCG
jgi:hypothetical protein